MTQYWRSKTDGSVVSNLHRGVDVVSGEWERVTVKPWKPKRIKVGDRIVTTAEHFTGGGHHGTLLKDDGSNSPYHFILDDAALRHAWPAGVWGSEGTIRKVKK